MNQGESRGKASRPHTQYVQIQGWTRPPLEDFQTEVVLDSLEPEAVYTPSVLVAEFVLGIS